MGGDYIKELLQMCPFSARMKYILGAGGWFGVGNQVVFIIRDLMFILIDTTRDSDTVNCNLN